MHVLYKASPKGEGSWMRTVTYAIKNCVVQKISLKKDCLNCPITSPFGILTNKSDTSFVITHDATIIWTPPVLNQDEKCSLKRVHKGTAVITKLENGNFKLIDETNQLEYHYRPEIISICKHNFHKLLNIETAYIQLPDNTQKDATRFFNQKYQTCLSYPSPAHEKCISSPSQKFILKPNLLIQVTDKNTSPQCLSLNNQTISQNPL